MQNVPGVIAIKFDYLSKINEIYFFIKRNVYINLREILKKDKKKY